MTPTATSVAAPPAAVLWDMDGTLVDTEPYWMAGEHELVAAFGGTWTDDDARSIIGFDLLDAAAELRDRGGVDLEPEEIVERLLDGVVARVREHVPWRPGARRLLTELNALGVPCALVTMSWARLVDAVVEALAPITFQAVVTGDEVEHGKPHPQPYLLAAEAPRRRSGAVRGDRGLPDPASSRPVRPAASCVAVPNIVADRPGTRADHRAHAEGHRSPATSVEWWPPRRRRRRPRARRHRRRRAGARSCSPSAGAGGRGDRRRAWRCAGDGDDAAPRRRPPAALAVHAWTPYWALEDALPDLEARADHASPSCRRCGGWRPASRRSRSRPNTPAAEAEQFVDAGPRPRHPARGVDPRRHRGRRDGRDPRRPRAARPATSTRSPASPSDGDFAGIDIDYEQFAFADGRDTWAATRPNWVAFVEELADRLHADGRTLTVSIPPVYDAEQTADSGFWVYDYAAITPLVDAIRVMAYDYSVASGDAGPIAPLPWVEQVIAGTIAASGDASKLVLGVPLYGYNWPVATTGHVPVDRRGRDVGDQPRPSTSSPPGAAPRRSSIRRRTSGRSPYDLAVDDGTTTCTQHREVHYVDADGAQVRMQRAVDAGFGGVALFAFGYDDPRHVDGASTPWQAP